MLRSRAAIASDEERAGSEKRALFLTKPLLFGLGGCNHQHIMKKYPQSPSQITPELFFSQNKRFGGFFLPLVPI